MCVIRPGGTRSSVFPIAHFSTHNGSNYGQCFSLQLTRCVHSRHKLFNLNAEKPLLRNNVGEDFLGVNSCDC